MSSPAYQTFIQDPGRTEVLLLDARPYDIAAGATTTLRVSSAATPPGVTNAYLAQLEAAVSFQIDTFIPGTVGVLPRPTTGSVRIANYYGNLDTYADASLYAWDARQVVLRIGGYSPKLGRWLNFDEYEPRYYQAKSATLERDGSALIITLRDPNRQFEDELQSRTFLDTGWTLKGGGTSSDFVDFSNPAKLQILNDLTLQGRFYYKANAAYQHLLGWTGGPFRLGVDATDHLRLDWLKATVATTKTMTATLTDGDPYVFEVILTDTQVVMTIVPESTRTATRETFAGTGFTGRDAPAGADAYRFFKSWSGANASPSMFDFVRVWSVAKTEASLFGLRYRALTAGEKAQADLKQNVDFDDGTGSTVTDTSSSAANGTINGTCHWYRSLLGSPDAAGNVLPDAWGEVEGAEPVLVDPGNFVYMVGSTSVQAIDSTEEGGIEHDLDTAYTDVFSFLAATTDPGERDTLITGWGSFFRLGSKPTRKITFSCHGDASGSGYIDTVADIARRILTSRGKNRISDPSGLLTTTFSDLNTAAPGAIGLYVNEKTTRAEVLNRVLSTAGAVVYTERATGLVGVYQFTGVTGTSVLTLTQDDILSIDEELPDVVSWRQLVGYGRCWSPMDSAEIAPGSDRFGFYSKATRWAWSDGDNRGTHPLAEEVRSEALWADRDDAVDEANRRQALFGSPHKPLRIRANARGLELDRFQVVTVSFTDLSAHNRAQQRLGLGTGTNALILGMSEAVRAAEESNPVDVVELVVWR